MRIAPTEGERDYSLKVVHSEFLEVLMALEKSSVFVRILRAQLVAGALGFTFLVLIGQAGFAFSLFYGLMLMAGNAWWLAHRLEKTQDMGVEASQRSLFAGASLRFVALIAGLLLGHLIGLHLLAVASGMFIAQAVVFVTAALEFKKGEGLG